MKFKKTKFVLMILFILFLSTFVFGQFFQASVLLNQVGRACDVIASDTVLLRQINATGNCFSFSANNIFLDCANFEIVGNGSGIAINITNKENIVIKNCIISNFTIGLDRDNASNNLIINVTTINVTDIIKGGKNTIQNSSAQNNTNLLVADAIVDVLDSRVENFNFTNISLRIVRNNSAELNFTTPITGLSTATLDSLIVLKNDSIKANTITAAYFNTTAHLTFFPQNFTNIEAKVDFNDAANFVSCPANVCFNQAIVGSKFEFDVAHFTTFSFGPTVQPGPSPAPSPGGGSGGGGGAQIKPKVPVDLEVSPELIESFMKAGEKKEIVLEIKNGLKARDVDISLDGPNFMFLNDHLRSLSLSLPAGETWKILLTVQLPKNALGINLGSIKIKGQNLEKSVSIRIVSGSGVILKNEKEQPAAINQNTAKAAARPARTFRNYIPFYPEYRQQIESPSSAINLIFAGIIILLIALISVAAKLKFKSIKHNIKMYFAMQKHQMHKHKKVHHKLVPDFTVHLHNDKELQIQQYQKSAADALMQFIPKEEPKLETPPPAPKQLPPPIPAPADNVQVVSGKN